MTSPLLPGLVSYMLYPELVAGSLDQARSALMAVREHPEFAVWELPYREGMYGDEKVRLLLQDRILLLGTQTTFIQNGINLSAVDEEEWLVACRHLERAVSLAADIGAAYVALWAGESTAAAPGCTARFLDAVGQVADRARGAGIRLLIEPFPRCSFGGSVLADLATAESVCRASGGVLGVMFDPAHHTLAGGSLPPASWECIDYVQLAAGGRADDGRPVDSHPLFGAPNSTATWREMVDLLADGRSHGYQGPAVFEVKAEPNDRTAMLARLAKLSRSIP
jgi:sugar phosphate isomerase/epimerase